MYPGGKKRLGQGQRGRGGTGCVTRWGGGLKSFMRMEPEQISAIREQLAAWVPGSEAFVFGSRTDPSARGGDIDLLILAEQRLLPATVRSLRRAILDKIGEQKLDIVCFARSESHPFKDLALATAERL